MSKEYTLNDLNALHFMGESLTVARCGEENKPAPQLFNGDASQVFAIKAPLSELYFSPERVAETFSCGQDSVKENANLRDDVSVLAPELAKPRGVGTPRRGREK